MRHFPLLRCLSALAALSVVGCATFGSQNAEETEPPLAESSPTVADTPASSESPQPEKAEATPPPRVFDNDGLRLPDMLALPSERELTRPAPEPDGGGTGEIIARPPVEP